MSTPLLLSRDPLLAEEVARRAAAAGVVTRVLADPGAALAAWAAAGVVLVGADLAAEVAGLHPPRRAGVHVLSWAAPDEGAFRVAVDLGAESVTRLPDAGEWLGALLADVADDRGGLAPVVAVAGGAGGAGATTLACALAQLAAREGPAMLVDLDPCGPGLDRVLGLEDEPGAGWRGLVGGRGRVAARALREGVPRRGGLGVLTWRPGEAVDAAARPDARAVREALASARRGHDLVVLDLPRAGDPVVEEVVRGADLTVVVVPATVAGVAAAARTVAPWTGAPVRLVLRGRGLDAETVARTVGVPVLAHVGEQRGLAEAVDLGLGPLRSPRSQLGRAARQVLDRVRLARVAA